MIKKKFSIGATVQLWSSPKLVYSRDLVTNETIRSFHQKLGTCSLHADPPTPASGINITLSDDDSTNLKNLNNIFHRAKQQKLRLLFVVLPTQRRETYAQTKTLADTRHGIHTICVIAEKLAHEKGQLQYMANVTPKANLKMSGANQCSRPRTLASFATAKR